jgi:Xaa-Pro dipeptidase
MAAAALDAELPAFVGRDAFAYPHHSGPSIGTAVHEFPRIVPDGPPRSSPTCRGALPLRPGDRGVRGEHMFRVTRTGCEVLHRFGHAPCCVEPESPAR